MAKNKLRAAIYYDNSFGRNDGPPLYYFNVLKSQLKLDTMHLIPEGDTRRFGKFDLHFWVDWGEDGLPLKDRSWSIPDDGGKKIYVVSDAHFGAEYRYNKAKEFDYVFFNQKHYVKEYLQYLSKVEGIGGTAGENPAYLVEPDYIGHVKLKNGRIQKIFYLPHAAEPKAYPKSIILKKFDISFIGHIQETHVGNGVNVTRLEALDRMFKEFPNFYFGSRNPMYPEKNMFEDAAHKFSQSRIVFNISAGNDLNMRFFETLSTGSFLLTNKIPELESIKERGLIDGVHYVSYTSLDDAVKKAKYYLEHEKEREAIALAGHKELMKNHTYKHRVLEILEKVK